jgi:hypothetical protein
MSCDLFLTHAPHKLAEAITQIMVSDQRSLPPRAKAFAAVAKMQGFDAFPDLKPAEEIDRMIKDDGCVELNRGLSGSNGIPAMMYAKELVLGTLYPGTQSAFGTGIYLTDLGCPFTLPTPAIPGFSRIAHTAHDHAGAGENGVVLRCILKKNARILTHEEVKELRRDNKNRYREAQLSDCGSLTAALGCDGFQCDGIGKNAGEKWYVVVNRTPLIFQSSCVRFSATASKIPPS